MPQRLRLCLTCTLIALLLFLPAGMVARADSGTDDTHLTIDGYTIDLAFPDGPAKVGPNALRVQIRAADGQPVSTATVQIAPIATKGESTVAMQTLLPATPTLNPPDTPTLKLMVTSIRS